MPEPLTIAVDELAALLRPPVRYPIRWLQRHHADLTEKHGMPKKLPSGWVWSRLAILTWIGTYGAPAGARAEATQNLIRQQQRNILEAFSGRAA